MKSREIRLKSRPDGMPGPDNFAIAETDVAAPAQGQVRVRNLFMSVDPYMRGRMSDRPSYVPPFELGKALQGHAIGEVVESEAEGYAPGDLVSSMYGWREAFTADAGGLEKLPKGAAAPQAFLGVLGMPGLTAYSGLLAIGAPKAGDTVFVSGAAGAVGSVVCQIAKIKGCAVVASAGSDEKLAWLKSVGVDGLVNYKKGGLLEQVRAAAPKGVDVYFDNVGGEHLEVAMEVARPFARFVECGMIAQYNNEAPAPGPRNMAYIVGKRLKLQGFIVFDFAHMRDDFVRDMSGWVAEGKVRWEETIRDGIEAAPEAFLDLFRGANTGKMLVRL